MILFYHSVKELKDFLLTRPSVLSKNIYSRLGKAMELGAREKLCHKMELEEINLNKPMEILIQFPNGAEKVLNFFSFKILLVYFILTFLSFRPLG